MKKKAILKALKLYFGQEAEHPLDFRVKVNYGILMKFALI